MKTMIGEAIEDGAVIRVETHLYHVTDGYPVVFIGDGWMCNNPHCDGEWEDDL